MYFTHFNYKENYTHHVTSKKLIIKNYDVTTISKPIMTVGAWEIAKGSRNNAMEN